MKFTAGTAAAWTAVEIAWVVVIVAVVWSITYLMIWAGENMSDREQAIAFIAFVVGGLVVFGCGCWVG